MDERGNLEMNALASAVDEALALCGCIQRWKWVIFGDP